MKFETLSPWETAALCTLVREHTHTCRYDVESMIALSKKLDECLYVKLGSVERKDEEPATLDEMYGCDPWSDECRDWHAAAKS